MVVGRVGFWVLGLFFVEFLWVGHLHLGAGHHHHHGLHHHGVHVLANHAGLGVLVRAVLASAAVAEFAGNVRVDKHALLSIRTRREIFAFFSRVEIRAFFR